MDPPDGVIDARQPHPIVDFVPRQGIQVLTVQAPSGADDECFTLCETRVDGFANGIAAVFEGPLGIYTIILDRAITPSAATTLTYEGDGSEGTFIFHSGNVNGDSVVNALDVIVAVDCMEQFSHTQTCSSATLYQLDMDHSGVTNALDLLRLLDLLNGAGTYSRMIGSPLPQGPCP